MRGYTPHLVAILDHHLARGVLEDDFRRRNGHLETLWRPAT
jgi:hypothetical protein